MKKINSSHISHIHYDEKLNRLDVQFHGNGQTYSYYGVNKQDYNALEKAPSIGKHFIKHIKDKYKHFKK